MPNDRDIHEEILLALRQISQATDLQSRALFLQCGLTGPQLIVLKELNRSGRISIGSLARRVSLSQATVTGIVERLEKRGLVERARDQTDRRRVLVQCTSRGNRISKSAPSVLQEGFAQELTRLSDWEQNFILSALQRVSAMMQTDRLHAERILTDTGKDPESPELDAGTSRDETTPDGGLKPAV